MPRCGVSVNLLESQQIQLQQWKRAHGTPQQVVQRLEIVRLAAEGLQDIQIAEELGINFKTVSLWRRRWNPLWKRSKSADKDSKSSNPAAPSPLGGGRKNNSSYF